MGFKRPALQNCIAKMVLSKYDLSIHIVYLFSPYAENLKSKYRSKYIRL